MTQTCSRVISEIETFIMNSTPHTVFDVLTASPTYSQILMANDVKKVPRTERATIKKILLGRIRRGEGAFSRVQIARVLKGNRLVVQKSVNGAIMLMVS